MKPQIDILDNPNQPTQAQETKSIEKPDTPIDGSIAIDLPSHFVPYEWDTLRVRPFKVKELMLLAHAPERGISVVIDAVGATLDKPVRQLTIGDFMYILGWLRIYSFHKTPYKILYTSRYGNENELIIDKTNLHIDELSMSKEEYLEACENKYNIPRVSDLEHLDPNNSDTELAQWFFAPATIKQKVTMLESLDMAWLEGLAKWKERCKHGLTEQVKVIDSKFDVHAYLPKLKQQISDLDHDIAMFSRVGRANDALFLNRQQLVLTEELEKLQAQIDKGEEVKPEEETVSFQISAASFLQVL